MEEAYRSDGLSREGVPRLAGRRSAGKEYNREAREGTLRRAKNFAALGDLSGYILFPLPGGFRLPTVDNCQLTVSHRPWGRSF